MITTPLNGFYHWESTTPQAIFLRQPIHDQWHVFTYQQAGEEARRIASGLKALGLPPGSNIAILSKNCAHWLIADLAIWMAGYVSVPIYPTLSAQAIQYILEHSESKAIFVGKLDNFIEQAHGIPHPLPKISFPFYGQGVGYLWEEWLKQYEPIFENTLRPDDEIATVMYSSGTTGTPKGVMLSFGALGFVGNQMRNYLCEKKPQHFFSYLPLSHIAERALMQMTVLCSGSLISFTESLEKFAANLEHEQPTIFGGVPRIYAKFQEGVLAKMPQKKLNRLLAIPIVKTIIKKAIQKKLGMAKAEIIVSGAAPTPVSLLQWYAKLGVTVRETYGMTENTAYSHSNYKAIKLGTVGQPWPGVEVKVSEDGEVLIRHAGLMKGYFKDEATTTSVFTQDGFLRTGDKGTIDAEGFLTITGRLKDQFKTDKAKFIAPAPIELELSANTDIEQCCVVGMGIPQPIALITLSLNGKAKSKEEIRTSLEDILVDVNAKLESYEKLEKAVILSKPWTIENGLMTPSLKVKRNEVERIYLEQYPKWYADPHTVVWES